MINPRLNDCVDCTTIPNLLSDIDCKLKDLGNSLYNNTVFALNLPVPRTVFTSLINYKRILTYKLCNPDYCQCYTVKQIASRIKILIHK